MLERCDTATIAVYDTAVAEAQRHGRHWIGTEHLLVALTVRSGELPGLVADLLPATDQVRAAIAAAPAGPARSTDTALLATLGIDLDHVRAAARTTFGPRVDQLDRHRPQPWQPWRRPARSCTSLLGAGRLRASPRTKEALARAFGHATGHQRVASSPLDLLAGILDTPGARAAGTLDELTDLPALRQAVEDTGT